ncbi:hypothetical protein P2G88_03750 [Aliiglaciecola sp. CAU 1673]|uniref:hypothetical protein n=1 Tax=Aliiglaciecola sp. CAU 1673 TaxID=3032595 RepID=UPI0023DC4EA2|nr:hypothetical protein [Aliiglaciecola sp. CAU 1673]MDF2177358.1 hypothetical protein [Aliiglaciecola sp. CAU 1673]
MSTQKSDLTRWNRAGLKRFRYVDGNAVTYLEVLREAMAKQFTEGGKLLWNELEVDTPDPESLSERQARLLKQYQDKRRDYGWEILRTHARSLHILGEYLDAYANESYLGTATQWANVRSLVEMLDYHPAPPASAQTSLALLAKTGKRGQVKAGFACKDKPEDGSAPSVFETLEDLDIDDRLNVIKARDWDKSQVIVTLDANNRLLFPLTEAQDISVGEMGILRVSQGQSSVAMAVKVTAVTDTSLSLEGKNRPPGFPGSFKRHQVSLLLTPEFKQAPLLRGQNVVALGQGHGLNTHMVVMWTQGSSWQAARVEQVQGNRIRLSSTPPATGTPLYQAAFSEAQDLQVDGDDVRRVILPTTDYRETWALFGPTLNKINSFSIPADNPYTYKDGNTYSLVYYLPKADADTSPEVAAIVQSANVQALEIDGKAKDLNTNDWLLVESEKGYECARLLQKEEGEQSTTLTLDGTFSTVSLLRGAFSQTLRPLEYDQNLDPVFLTQAAYRSDSHCYVPLTLTEWPEILCAGRKLIVQGKSSAIEVVVEEADELNQRLKIAPPIPGSELSASGDSADFTRYHTKLFANVVSAGHGEREAQKVLGSGDATQSAQRFHIKAVPVSFIADQNFSNGVRCDLDVEVEGRRWQQVPSLSASSATDHHFQVRMQEDGSLWVEFGDGVHGRRLPSGNNNLKASYRVGAGLSANLPAGSLVKAVKPHAYIESLLQPLAASGGNDMEGVRSMREQAPATLLSLERAVSLSDFTHLAMGYSGIWQARAMALLPGNRGTQKIQVAVIPAGGGELGSLAANLSDYLSAHALPGVQVEVVSFDSLILDLVIDVTVDTQAFAMEVVSQDVQAALEQAFSLKQVRLGKPLYRSDLFKVIEQVKGVMHSQVRINPDGFFDASGASTSPRQVATGSDGAVKRVSPYDWQAIYLDPAQSVLQISTQAKDQ